MHLKKLMPVSLLDPETKVFKYNQEFRLESGASLPELLITYTTCGELSAKKDNVVWVFHALTANSNPVEWWPGLIGKENQIDPSQYFIVCANIIGSSYGTTGPRSINPQNGDPYGLEFPLFTIKDIVKAHQLIQNELGIESIKLGIGGSMGGQQLLEWAINDPDLFENIVPIATNARHSPWGIAFNESQRLSLEADPSFRENIDEAGQKGMKAARAIAMLSYRNQLTYEGTQLDVDKEEKIDNFKASTYQAYQGEKLVRRFNAHSYYYLAKAMDTHNVSRGRYSMEKALSQITARTAVIGINSDLLFTPREQSYLADNIQNSELYMIDSFYGHDGFLIETVRISEILKDFLHENNYSYQKRIA